MILLERPWKRAAPVWVHWLQGGSPCQSLSIRNISGFMMHESDHIPILIWNC
jgi:hypothetical protein